MGVSVCMASYNGEQYIIEQLDSILSQLSETDEIVIVDDCSTDNTVEVVRNLNDSRIKLYSNEVNSGEVFSFSRAMMLAKNKFVFLSDQDDVWGDGRVSLMCRALNESAASVLTSNFTWMNASGEPIKVPFDGVSAGSSKKHIGNIIDIFMGKTNYFGCAMAIRKDFLPIVLPIPSYVESHDLWVALASNICRSNIHLDDKTFIKRKHYNNATSTVSTRPILIKLWSRVVFIISMVNIYFRCLIVPRPASQSGLS